jgi:hypothetical protein
MESAPQLATLVAEVSRLQGAPLARESVGPPLTSPGSGADGGGGGGAGQQPLLALPSADQLLTSNAVISARLVGFRTLGELVEQNR